MTSETLQTRFGSIGTSLALAWLGMLYHDLAEFGRPAIEGSILFLVIAVLLFFFWWQFPQRRGLTTALMLVYGLIGLFGAVTSVLPLGFWPWVPEQSLGHYLSHGVWIFMVLPLIWVSVNYLRSVRSES
jgi:heme A synthase